MVQRTDPSSRRCGSGSLAPLGPGPVANDLAFHSLGQPVLDEQFYVWYHSMEI